MPECETTAPALLDRDGTSVRCLLYAPAAEPTAGQAVHQAVPKERPEEKEAAK
jgi:hypothetical protein